VSAAGNMGAADIGWTSMSGAQSKAGAAALLGSAGSDPALQAAAVAAAPALVLRWNTLLLRVLHPVYRIRFLSTNPLCPASMMDVSPPPSTFNNRGG
jgi:hypothetical protein